ncbi:sporulation protein YqfD [Sporolactobacillus sp. THM7-7]|nr:sporulation protein YqfD [Sporolactobacillus sp. THM7-7]
MKLQKYSVHGYVKAAIIGGKAERFMTRCVEEGIRLWRIERKNETTLICHIKLTDRKLLKKLLKESGCRIRFLERGGMPFLWVRLRKRLGILAGLCFFLFVLLILSNMVWRIDVQGADPKLEEEIRSLMKKDRLYVGALEFFIPETDRLESRLSSKLTRATWIGVSKKGTTYLVDVVQKKYPKPRKAQGPRHLVAAKQAIIHHWIVDRGQVAVESNQFVKPGQLLVLGRIGREDDPKFVSANGKVIGETWYRSETEIPLNSRLTIYTGKTYRQHNLRLWHISVPIWGFKKNLYKHADKEVIEKPVRFLIWELPFAYKQTVYREKEPVRRSLTEEEAMEEARETADNKLLDSLPDGAQIVSETIERKRIEDGKLKISSHYVVYEDIARPQPIDKHKEMEKLKKKKEADEN